MLPRLARVFSVTTDELLGVASPPAPPAPREEPAPEPEWNPRPAGAVGIALWILLAGSLLFLVQIPLPGMDPYRRESGFLRILWTTGLLVYGLFGLYPRFSFFRLGCALFGGWGIAGTLGLLSGYPSGEALAALFLIYCGLALLGNALLRPRCVSAILRPGHHARSEHMEYDWERGSFDCACSFGENRHLIQLPRFTGGRARLSFGSLVLDLTGCQEITGGSQLDLDCSFGAVALRLPRTCRAEPTASTAFAGVEIKGTPAPDAASVVYVNCRVSFGAVEIQYK